MKRFFSVKEASKLLGVSTNTIYKYIEEGKLTYRRIGKGRIKISFKSLAPFIQETDNIENTFDNTSKKLNSFNQKFFEKSISIRSFDLNNFIVPLQNDIVFFRLFKGVVFIGLGIIYFFTNHEVFTNNGIFPQELTKLLVGILPFVLFIAGLANLAEVLNPKSFSKYHLKLDILSSFIFSYLAFIALVSGRYIRFSFALSFVAVSLDHIIKGVNGQTQHNFFNSFIRFTLFLFICIGIALPLNPQLFISPAIGEFVAANKGLFAILWFGLIVAPIVYFASPYRKESIFITLQLVLLSIVGFFIGTYITIIQEWDVTYLFFQSGIFSVFLAWWIISKSKILNQKIYIIYLAFFWISISLLIGLFALKSSYDQIKREAENTVNESVDKVVVRVNSIFDHQRAVLLSFAGDREVVNLIEDEDNEKATSEAKAIYEKLPNLYRVLIYNKRGTAIGVYPRTTLAQGTNFFSRDYFQKTLNSYKGYISPSFQSILGEYTVMQTEPVFKDNQLVGIIGAGIDLISLSEELQGQLGLIYQLSVYDENGVYILSKNLDKIGSKKESVISQNQSMIVSNQFASIPKWEISLDAPVSELIPKISGANVILSILFLTNSLISMAFCVAISIKKDPSEKRNFKNVSPFSIPQFS